ncbi:MAG: IS66 family insertion sequence element accessory protein TnpB [Cypionkella sp.]
MRVHWKRDMEAVGFVEPLAARSAKRRWSDEAKGRMVAETQVPGVTVNEVALRHGGKTNHLFSWRTLARQGELVVPEVAGAEFALPVAVTQTLEVPVVTGKVDLVVGLVTARSDAATLAVRVTELVHRAAGLPVIFPSNRVGIMVATKPINFRKGHDSLAAMVKNELGKDPFTSTVFVFRAKKADRLKLLYWDGTGLVMAHKGLEELTFT